jgi:hypothetical protein
MLTRSSIVCVTSLLALLLGCSQSADTPSAGEGGSTAAGGATTSAGGSDSNGGATSNGGASVTSGGATGNGGATASNGGATSNGGSSNGGSSNGGSENGGSSNGGSSNGGAATGTGGGAPTAGSTSLACPDGCAQLSVPFALGGWDTKQQFEIYLEHAVDLTTATISIKLRKIAGKAGGVQILAKNGSPDYQWAQGEWIAVNDLSATDFETKSFVVASPSSSDANHPFDPTKVAIIAVQLNAGGAWYTDPPTNSVEDATALVSPTIIQLEELAITGASGAVPGPFGFESAASTALIVPNLDAAGLAPATGKPWAIAGSAVMFVGP